MQTELSLTPAAKPAKLRLTPEQLAAALQGQRWVLAKHLSKVLQVSDRTLRAAAAASRGRDTIISGQQGYCLLREATPDEARHAINWMLSQANQMTTRALAIQKAYHNHAQ